jgi:hypothetical protein
MKPGLINSFCVTVRRGLRAGIAAERTNAERTIIKSGIALMEEPKNPQSITTFCSTCIKAIRIGLNMIENAILGGKFSAIARKVMTEFKKTP